MWAPHGMLAARPVMHRHSNCLNFSMSMHGVCHKLVQLQACKCAHQQRYQHAGQDGTHSNTQPVCKLQGAAQKVQFVNHRHGMCGKGVGQQRRNQYTDLSPTAGSLAHRPRMVQLTDLVPHIKKAACRPRGTDQEQQLPRLASASAPTVCRSHSRV